MFKPQGYGIITDPEMPAVEHDTTTCAHCNKISIIPPGWKPESMPNRCKGCMGYLCLGCWGERTLGKPCVTWKQQLDEMEAREIARRSYGL